MTLTASTFSAASAQSARPESVVTSFARVESGCPISAPRPASGPAGDRFLGTLIGTLFAGLAGDLVTSGLNAMGDAIEQASNEHAFVAEGTTSFNFYKIENLGGNPRNWAITPDFEIANTDGTIGSRCIVLAFQDDAQSGTPLSANAIKNAFSAVAGIGGRADAAETALKRIGLSKMPALYVEAELRRATDGMLVRPVLIRYATRLPGAPSKASASELDISFATPGGADTTDIGTLFALSRVKLPKIAPAARGGAAALMTEEALAPYAGVIVPLRPTTGSPDTELQRRNAVRSAVETKAVEVKQLLAAQSVAQRNIRQNATPDQQQALQNALDDAETVLASAQGQHAELRRLEATLAESSAGATNVKVRFLLIRDPNKLGLAIAKALKAQADATGKAVTTKLTPTDKPAWSELDSAMVNAQVDVRAAQRALDQAIANGETDKLAALQDGVLKAQAAANQAAAAANRPLPYIITP